MGLPYEHVLNARNLHVLYGIRNNIRKSQIIEINQEMRTGSRDGQLLFDTALRELMNSGRIDYETACFYATDPAQI